MEPSAYTCSLSIAPGSYSEMKPEGSSLASSDGKIYQNGQEKGHDFTPEFWSSSHYSSSDTPHIPFLREKRSEEREKRLETSKSFSIADISSQLHRIRKAQEREMKSISNAVEESGPPALSFSDTVDISQGFWSKEDWKNSPNHKREPLRRKKSPLSPYHRGEEFRSSSQKDSLYFGHDISYDNDPVDHHAGNLQIAIDSYNLYDNPHPSDFTHSLSSSPSVSSNQKEKRRRRTSKISPAAKENSYTHQGDSSEAGDIERDTSDDENELRKQLLSSLALKRYSSVSEVCI